MKTVNIVLEANGENSGTYGFISFLITFIGDLTEKCYKFHSWDDNHTVEVDKYKVVEANIPDWMTENQYGLNEIDLKYAVALGGNAVLDMSPNMFYNFIRLDENWQYLWNYLSKQKSEFGKSLKGQYDNWLKSESKYGMPLSQKQYNAATRYAKMYQAKQISEHTYNH